MRPRKHLGQHFLADPNIVARIVDLAGVGVGSNVVEVGAGTGTLTRALAATGATVVSFEIDESLAPVLDEALEGSGVDLRFADVMDVDLDETLPPGEWTMVANLPYGVGTPLLLDTLAAVPRVTRFVVMVQREVADRLSAEPGSKTYGLATVVAALHGRVRFGFSVGPSVFVPPPDVESAVIIVERVVPDPLAPEASRIAAAAFNQRRKMVRRSLRAVFDQPIAVLKAAGIDETWRAEDLSPEDYLRLAKASS
ncbi:MAG: ribosomal RNA small subunit methyltransferase A [Actinobacteria bacterium]|nr:ribosomal RNA small subunit methyltransferase A [Actinomycetota bacterium]